MEKIKRYAGKGERAPCYFYRSSSGVEIDLFVDNGNQYDIYEIKFSSRPTKDMGKSLLQFMEEYPVEKTAILNLRKERLPLTKDLDAIHWSHV